MEFILLNQVINDLLDPTGQNLRVREDAQVCPYSFLLKFSGLVDVVFLLPQLETQE